MTKSKPPKVSIIIPVKDFNWNLDECVKHCLKLRYADYEVIVLPDSPAGMAHNVRVIPTGPVGPSQKRNTGIKEATGEIVAFLDDDAFPPEDWLDKAVGNFEDGEVAAVGGPGVTPEEDDPRQKAGGSVYSCLMGGGVYRYRYTPLARRLVDDFPTCNIIARKSVLDDLGGFSTSYWPGEDTTLCLEITRKLGKKIVYDPEVLVYHHRRALFGPHLRQICSYALHRGYFAKRFPATSLRLPYFLPSLLTLGLLFGWLPGFIHPVFSALYLAAAGAYFASALFTAARCEFPMYVFSGLVLTHLCYGTWFIKGLLSGKLEEE